MMRMKEVTVFARSETLTLSAPENHKQKFDDCFPIAQIDCLY